jgi:hypothetical protein
MKAGCCLVSVLLYGSACFSQIESIVSDDSLSNEYQTSFRKIYFDDIQGNALLYRGIKYAPETRMTDGFPYFQSDIMRTGTISFLGVSYGPLKFYYDLVLDALVTANYAHDDLMVLASDKIDSFSFGRHVFVRLSRSPDGVVKNGFYEQLYPGDPGVYVRRTKKFHFSVGNQVSRYVEDNEYFIRNKDNFYRVTGKEDVLKIFADRKEEIKKFIQTSHLDFRDNPDAAFTQTTIFYTHLTAK